MQAAREPVEFLPDFCTGSRVLHVLLVCEAVAVVLALGEADPAALPRRLLLLSVYLQWIGICSAAALCLVRRHAGHLDARGVVALAYLTLLAVTFAITEITFVAGRYAGFSPLFGPAGHLAFVARSLGICAVVAALALRYFWLRSAWRQHARAEVQARLEALQARIEPHFLFNSLNSVAALIADADGGALGERLAAMGLDASRSSSFAAAAARLLAAGVAPETRATAFWVPGRIEVLGTHTDYAGGRSLLCAVNRGFSVVAADRDDAVLRVFASFELTGEADVAEVALAAAPEAASPAGWAVYPAVTARRLARNFGIRGSV